MKFLPVWALCCLFFLQGAFAILPAPGPDDTIKAFYNYRIKNHLSGAPTEKEMLALHQWFTPQLCAKLEKAMKERDAFIKRYGSSEKPPWCDGDLYSSTFEGPTSFEIAGGAGDGKQSRVQVLFAYAQAGQKTIRWSDRLDLKLLGGKWLIDDIVYDLPLEFGNSRTLRQNLP